MSQLKVKGLVLGPLLFAAVYLALTNLTDLNADACKVLATAAWMVTWWVTDAVHVAVTALIPMILLPLLGVLTVGEATSSYGNPVIYLFMGGFIIALALEKHRLHERIALNMIRMTGTSGDGIIAGFTLASGLISMWISNTATAIMMLPIAVSVTQLISDRLGAQGLSQKGYRNFATGLMLSIAYAANIGGMATIVGTPPNVVMVALYEQRYEDNVSFTEWLTIGAPIAVAVLVLCYVVITRIAFPNQLKSIRGSSGVIKARLTELGPLTKAERMVLVIFGLTAFSWIFREYINSFLSLVFYGPGAGVKILDDTLIAMTGGLLMFSLPINLRKGEFLLSWEDMKRMPWGILILFGGGLCLARSLEESGLIQMIGDSVTAWGEIDLWILTLALAGIALLLTELMSNVALTTIFVPVVFGIADGLGYDPAVLAIPVTLAASCAFCLPISTPPNAILFASGHIRLIDMLRAGIMLNIISLITIVALSLLLVR
ncbi:MAG: DASS family sodium-coupled anion symporter [Cyclobacteriaceae bacterium]|nr:DASS family sodium-coupled anion symporter [Cyclobacteriaceae bacterium]